MGKRELILILAFALLGVGVYWLTVPPAEPGEQGFSVGRIFDNIRREVRGNRASAEATTTTSLPLDPAVTELRVNVLRGPITVIGEDRDTVESELAVRSTGYDEAEALQLARETRLMFEETGSLLNARVEYPTPGRQTVTLTLRVPSRLHLRIEGMASRLDVRGVAAVEAAQTQGETAFRHISGRVVTTHRGGTLVIADVGSLRITARGSTTTLEAIRGEAEISTQAGELAGSALAGPIELSGTATRVNLQDLQNAGGMIRITLVGGALSMTGLSTDSRIDLRNAPLDLQLERPAEVGVFSEGAEAVRITAPEGGFRLDAVAREGRITGDPADLFTTWRVAVKKSDNDSTERLAGTVAGGGPLLTVRSRSDIAFVGR